MKKLGEKLTDEELVSALRRCSSGDPEQPCDGCPAYLLCLSFEFNIDDEAANRIMELSNQEAEWIVPDENYPDTCSNCMFEFVFDGDDNYVPKYCPECGRKMIRRRTYDDN